MDEGQDKEAAGAHRVIKNSILILIARGVQIASSSFILIAVARYLSIEEYGDYVFIVAFVSSVMALTYFGIQQVAIREISRDRANAGKHLGSAIILRALLSAVASAILLAAVFFIRLKGVVAAGIIIAILSEFFLTFGMLVKAVFQAYERMIYEAVVTIVYSIVLAACISAIIFLNMGFLWLFASAAIANTAQFILATCLLYKKFVRPEFKIGKEALWDFFKHSSVIGVGIFFYQNLFKIDVLMLKWLSTAGEVALFQVPHGLIMQIEVLPAALVASSFPMLSRLLKKHPERFIHAFAKLFRFIFILSILPAIFLFAFSGEIISLVFGSKYAGSSKALAVVAWAIIPLSLDMLLNSVLVVMNKQRYNVIYGGFALAANFLASLYFIPRYGFMAASYIALLSYMFLFFCSFYVVVKSGLPAVLGKVMARAALATALSCGAILAAKPYSIVAATGAGVVLYFLVLFITRTLSAEELFLLIGPQRKLTINDGAK